MSTSPLIAYYHDGFLKLSIHRFAANSTERNSFISNTDLAKKVFEEAANGTLFEGMNEEELRNFQTWTLDRLHRYLTDIGRIDDPNWVNNFLRPKFQKAMVHITRATAPKWLKHPTFFEVMGWDYTLDDDLTLWFLEANWNPALLPYSNDRRIILQDMLQDVFQVAIALLRSRMKRIILFINRLTAKYPDGLFKIDLDELAEYKEQYDKLNRNYFDPEYEPKDIKLVKIIDENLSGKDRYMGLIEEGCL